MNTYTALIAFASLNAALVTTTAQAALQGRDLNGSINSFEAYYDTDLNITWLADTNLKVGNQIVMTWAEANTFVGSLSFTVGVNVYDNWRLPTVTDTDTPGCVSASYSGTDCGSNVNTATGEMAHLFYDELGNKAYWDTAGAGPQTGWGLTNTGPFPNFQPGTYWSGTEYVPNTDFAWVFATTGSQVFNPKSYNNRTLAVSPGDVGAVPEADTWAMLLAGLALVGVAVGRRRG